MSIEVNITFTQEGSRYETECVTVKNFYGSPSVIPRVLFVESPELDEALCDNISNGITGFEIIGSNAPVAFIYGDTFEQLKDVLDHRRLDAQMPIDDFVKAEGTPSMHLSGTQAAYVNRLLQRNIINPSHNFRRETIESWLQHISPRNQEFLASMLQPVSEITTLTSGFLLSFEPDMSLDACVKYTETVASSGLCRYRYFISAGNQLLTGHKNLSSEYELVQKLIKFCGVDDQYRNEVQQN